MENKTKFRSSRMTSLCDHNNLNFFPPTIARLPPTPYNKKIKIHGHRGARGAYPENTLPAFRYAIENNVDFLELDLQMTKDNKIVICHDRNINTNICDGVSYPIKTLTLEEIKKYDCGSKQNSDFNTQKTVPGTKIPLFIELINMIQTKYKHKKIMMNIEIKTQETIDTDNEVYNFSNKLIKLVKKYKIIKNVIIESFDIRALEYVNKIEPSIKTSYLIMIIPSLDDLINTSKRLNIRVISPKYLGIDKNIIKILHENGFEILPWVINDVNVFKQFIEYGVDGIITDYPKEMKDYLIENYY